MSHVILSCAYEPGFPSEWEGLDYQSAVDAIPRWYGVSTGNGNDGVSHMFPDYYVRTFDPWLLAYAATIDGFKPEWQDAAIEAMDVSGEAEYGIQACILDPVDYAPEVDHSECEDGEDCEGCSECEDHGTWSDSNGAWFLLDVFPVADVESERSSAMQYGSIEETFGVEAIAKAKEAMG